MDKGGELYANPKVRKLFQLYGYKINPTGADASRQNAVERHHLTVENGVCWTNQLSTDIVAVADTVLQLNTIRSMQLLY